MLKQFYIYILASRKNGTLYIGVTSNLVKRTYEHKNNLVEGFTQQYRIHTLVYFEVAESADAVIMREKQLKTWKRAWKIRLIEKSNPEWRDLYPDIIA
jgi:putative endonuclease